MIDVFRIDPDGVYDDATLTAGLGVSLTTLANSRKAGELRFVRKGNRTLYIGKWVLAWLEKSPLRQGGAK